MSEETGEKATSKFKQWVVKHQIGPSMNDKFFAERGKRPLPKLYSGFDGSVGDGWVDKILEPLATKLIELGWDRDLHQVKEKFGGLRFYTGPTTKAMDDLIDEAEKLSYKTCETCGEPGKTGAPTGFWLLTLCDRCHNDRAEAQRKLQAEYKKP